MAQNIKVALLAGGASPEREVSKATSKSVYNALKTLGYEVVVIDPAYGLEQPSNIEDFFAQKDYAAPSSTKCLEAVTSSLLNGVDTVFIGLHGKYGEDGTMQSLLEMKGIKYTGSKVLASALAMDKTASKIMFQHFDVQTPKWFVVTKDENKHGLIDQKIKKFFGYPCVIKPNDQGSTIGISLCRGEIEVDKAVKTAFEYSNKVIIEEYIPGRELTVAVLNRKPLPVLEIKPKSGFYDYESKYTSGKSDYIVPADLPHEVALHLQHQALLAFNSLGCENYARVDFRLNEKNESYCLEVNTLPGMTSTSLVPKMAKAVGISFEELIDSIIKYSLK